MSQKAPTSGPTGPGAAVPGKPVVAAVDLSKLSDEERALYQKYGRLPSKRDVVGHKLKERKYFDSGDYAMYKAGRTAGGAVGTVVPSPEMIPHSNPSPNPNAHPAHPHHLTSTKTGPEGQGEGATE